METEQPAPTPIDAPPARAQASAPPEPAVEVRGLVKRFGEFEALRGLDLTVARGSCFGLLGPNGAGKTTTVEILEGLQEPSAGSVRVLGRRWERDAGELRERIGVALQETQLADKLTVEEVTRLFRSFYRRGRTVEEVLRSVDLGPKRDARVHQLSGGQRQRLAVACALVGEPELLFLDEPTTGLDPQARRRLWEVVREYLDQGGTVVLTTHYMEEAAQMCDAIAIVDGGRVIAEGSPAELVASLGAAQVIEFRLADGANLAPGALESLAGVQRHEVFDGLHVLRVPDTARALAVLLAELDRRGLVLTDLGTHRATLDDVFLHLTVKALRDS
jgi:ABC-2 type transport system ATP-binding protein